MMRKKQHGLSMIELLLWLAVVAVIIIGIGRFFKNEQFSGGAAEAVARVKNVNEGFIAYLQSGYTPSSGYSYPNLVENKYVSAVDVTAPWGAPAATANPCKNLPANQSICPVISVSGSGNSAVPSFYIYVVAPPAGLCQQLYNELEQAGYDLSTSAPCPAASSSQITIKLSV